MKKFAAIISGMLLASGVASAAEAQGTGVVKFVDAKKNLVNVAHEPIPALKWPKMTMDLKVKDAKVLEGVKPGQTIKFDLDKDPAAGYVITRIEAVSK